MNQITKITAVAIIMFAVSSCENTSTENMETTTQEEIKDRSSSYYAAPEELRTWVDARAGTGEPVHWIAEGSVYEYPSGKKLFGMIGFDSSTAIWPDEDGDEVLHLTRKTFAYTDPETGEVLKEYNGKEVAPIAYPYQMISYRLENERIYGDVEQGVGDGVRVIEAKDGIPYRKMGSGYIYNASVFLDFPLPSGAQYEAWENYDFFIQPDGAVDEPHQMTWQRYGKRPRWAGEGQTITHLHSWRVESQDEFPAKLLAWAKEDQPMWLNPPKDTAEIRALQRGEEMQGWSD